MPSWALSFLLGGPGYLQLAPKPIIVVVVIQLYGPKLELVKLHLLISRVRFRFLRYKYPGPPSRLVLCNHGDYLDLSGKDP